MRAIIMILGVLVIVIVCVLALLTMALTLALGRSVAVAVVVVASLRMSGHRGKLLGLCVESQTMGITSGSEEIAELQLPHDKVLLMLGAVACNA